jgi:hypothetical protein
LPDCTEAKKKADHSATQTLEQKILDDYNKPNSNISVNMEKGDEASGFERKYTVTDPKTGKTIDTFSVPFGTKEDDIRKRINDIQIDRQTNQNFGTPQASNRLDSILNDGLDIMSGEYFDSTKSQPLASNTGGSTIVNNYNTMGGSSSLSGNNNTISPGLFLMSNPETTAQRVSYDMAKAAIL